MATDPTQLIQQLLGAGQSAGQAFAQGAQNQADLANAQQENQIRAWQFQQQQDAAAQQGQDQQAYQNDVNGWISGGSTPQGLTNLIARHPDQYKALQAGWQAKSDAQKQADLGFWGAVHGTLDKGDNKGAAQIINQRLQAEKAAGIDTTEEQNLADQIASGDATSIAGAKAHALAQVAAATGPDKFADAYGTVRGDYTLTPGAKRFDSGGNLIASAPSAETDALEVPVFDATGKRIGTRLIANGGKGVGLASTGVGGVDGSGVPGNGVDTSRLVNSAAGGGQVPANVQTLGQFVGWGAAMNQKGAKSSSAGTYQINGTTMAQFAPLALGPNWKSQPFTADAQDKVGEAIFDWAKAQPNPAAALRGRWVSLSPAKAAQLVQGSWQQAKGTIAQGETGGGAGASASAPSGSSDPNYIGPVGGAGDDDSSIGPAYAAKLNPGRRNLVQAIIDGRAPAPRPGSRFGEALAEDVARVDPTADATTLPMRQKARTDFSGNGKAAQAFAAYNRFAAHLNSAYELHLKLAGGYNGPGGDLAAQAGQSFQKDLVNQYNTEIEGAQGEFQKLTKMGQANEGEAKRLVDAAHAGQSSAARGGALKGMASLVVGGYQPLVDQWHSAFPGKPLPIDVSAGAKAAINNVLHDGKTAIPVGSNGAPQAHIATRTATGPNGQKIGLINGRWVAIR